MSLDSEEGVGTRVIVKLRGVMSDELPITDH